jgi:lipopolysaccharide biosynthesis glycosyltransferase
MMESRGVILYNRGEKCLVRAIVCLENLRKYWYGPVSFFLENTCEEFEKVCEHYNVDVIHNENPEQKALVRSAEVCIFSPYDRSMWLDSDCLVVGKIDEMFDYLDEFDVAIPWFAGWWSDGGTVSKRVKRYTGIAEQHFVDAALEHHPAINTGVLSFRKNVKFMHDWVELAKKGDGKMFIPDETAFQVLYPSSEDRIYIAPTDFNVSVLHDKGQSKDRRIIHYHGQKHVLSHKNCDLWKAEFKRMREGNIANINSFLKYADKRLKKYIEMVDAGYEGLDSETTIVTACDPHYVEILKHTYPNWVKYKKVDKYPVIVFVNGIDIETDPRLDFLRQDNVTMIPWSMDNVDSHREEMLSAFVFGASEHVKTDYWMKLDADSYATDDKPLITEKMKQYNFCGHKWGYSRPNHIEGLDEWAKNHWKGALKKASPMINEGRIEKNRFYHNERRTISFVQLHKTKFTNFCVKILKERRLPVPSQDTYLFYVASRFCPDKIGRMNFKKFHGFTQGRGRGGPESIIQKLKEVEEKNNA